MEGKKIDSSSIKLQNRELVYRFIREHQLVSKQDIVTGLRLSLPTVTQNLYYLNEQGLIDTTRQIKNTGGRNATAYGIQSKARYAVGVSLTGHHINVVTMNLFGEIGIVIRRRESFQLDSDEYLRNIGSMVQEAIEKAEISPECLLGVGISVPGLISEDGEEVVSGFTYHFTGKRREDICKYIPYPTRLFHDSFAAGYAERRANPALKKAFYIILGTSVGGAILDEHDVDEGENRKAGEVGHMIISPGSKRRCYCGNYGCFDTFCNSMVLDVHTNGDLAEFFLRKKEGEPTLAKVWEKYLDDLALGIHNVRMLTDTKIVLGGYVGPYLVDDFEKLCKKVDKLNSFAIEDKAEDYLVPCESRVETIAEGSARFFIDAFLDSVLRET
jgi:predicted NBD/HSP70 family sugar kinase